MLSQKSKTGKTEIRDKCHVHFWIDLPKNHYSKNNLRHFHTQRPFLAFSDHCKE